MHSLSRLLLIVLVTVLPTLRSFAVDPEPFLKRGRYVGTITVVEKIPLNDLNGIDTHDRNNFVSTKATGRVVGTVLRGIRVLGTPGTHLLGYLDEPNFAAIKINPPLAGETVDVV